MSERDDITREVIEDLSKNDAQIRKHASFWNFHKKSAKELGIFSEIFDRIEQYEDSQITEWGLCESDPPDIFARFANGMYLGVEITELVNQSAIQAQISASQSYDTELFSFDIPKAQEAIRKIIEIKERKVSKSTEAFDTFALLIHTDEFLLKSDEFEYEGAKLLKGPSEVFSSVYLLFSYEPDKQECPLIRLEPR